MTSSSHERILKIKIDGEGRHLVSLVRIVGSSILVVQPLFHFQRADSTLEIFTVLTPEEVEKKENKKAKKALKKGKQITTVCCN